MANEREMPKAYEPALYETAIYSRWEESGYFTPEKLPGKRTETFTIMMPPPNRTGILHVGHATGIALQDLMIRFERMRGKKTLWLPGTDHAAIATQVKVEQLLREEGMSDPRKELGREKFLARVVDFAEQSGEAIIKQTRKMGASCDWSRLAYTLDAPRNHAVNEMFALMYKDGIIERGDRIVNWDPQAQTNVSDDEIEWVEEGAPFYYFKYGPFEIGTSRPETKFGDKYVVLHPDDKRYAEYKDGQQIKLEWINGPITATVVKDAAIDMDFGTGVMTITPWHDATDFDIAERHKLDKEQVIGFDGRLLPIAGALAGQTINEARKSIVALLKEKGLLVKIDNGYRHRVAKNSRGGGAIEPQIMRQWFVRVTKPFKLRNATLGKWKKGASVTLKELMQEAVLSGQVKIVPESFEKIYFHWIDNLRDWCISRQIWFGHRIPVWYNGEQTVCAESAPEGDGWKQDEDTLDTWFSSGMWTFSTLGWPEKTKDFKTYHPTSVLETGRDIIFFWVARMILMSTYALGVIPFKTVYLHGLVRDEEGRKMSKSLGNIIDPLDVAAKYGTDAVRLSLIIGNAPGADTRIGDAKIAGFRNFGNKLWNIGRYVAGQTTDTKEQALSVVDRWIISRLDEVVNEVTQNIEKFNFSGAGELLREFTWNDFADWYVEIHKREGNNAVLKEVFDAILRLWHPFMPFVTETIHEALGGNDLLMIAKWPTVAGKRDEEAEQIISALREAVGAIRSIRSDYKVAPETKVDVVIGAPGFAEVLQSFAPVIQTLGRVENLSINAVVEPIAGAVSVAFGALTVSIPLAGMIDAEKERGRVMGAITETEQFIFLVSSRLNNADFVSRAPEKVVALERTKLAEAQERLATLKSQLAALT